MRRSAALPLLLLPVLAAAAEPKGAEPDERSLRAAIAARGASPDPRLLDALGALLARGKRIGEAVPLLRQAARLAPADAGIRKNLANALFAAGLPDEGERELLVAVGLPGERVALARNGQRLLFAAGRAAAGLRLAETAAAAEPRNPALSELVAHGALRVGDRDRAERIWSGLLAAGSVAPERADEIRSFVSLCRLARRPAKRPEGKAVRSALLVTIDTLRSDAVCGRSAHAPRTPDLERLEAESLSFTEARSAAPVTLPSHAAMLTSRFGPSTGVRSNGTDALPAGIPTLAEAARGAGLRTAAFVSAWVLERRFGLDRGFELYDDVFAHPKRKRGRFPVDRSGAETASRAAAWLRGLPADRGFLGWVHLYDPHSDYAPPAPYDEAFADRPYAGEVAFADLCVGYLLGELARLGRDGETLVIVTADHGEGLGDHGESTHGLFVYDSTLRVPLFVRDPGRGARRGIVDRPVRTVDLFPTIAERLRLPPPVDVAGESLAPLLRGGTLPEGPPGFAETMIPADFGWAALRAAWQGGRKLVLAPREELYDLRADRAERRNLLPGADAETLRRFLLRTLSARPPAKRAALDEEATRKLRSLGYLAAGGDAPAVPPFDPVALARAVDPKDRVASFRTYQAAASLEDDRRIAEALPLADRLVAADPRSPFLLSFRGGLREKAADLPGAARDYESAASAAPGDARFRFVLGLLHHRKGELAAAERRYREALAIDPHHLLAHYDLGRLLLESGRLDEGERETLAVLAISPESPQARNNLGYVRIVRDRDFEGGLAEIRRAVAAAPADPVFRESLASALWNAGRREEARKELAEALRLAVPLARAGVLEEGYGRIFSASAKKMGVPDPLPAGARPD